MQSNAYIYWQYILLSNYYVSNSASPGSFTCLSKVNYKKDLGVWVTNKLDSSLHCQKAVAKANKILGIIKRTFQSMSKDLFVFLYRTSTAVGDQ